MNADGVSGCDGRRGRAVERPIPDHKNAGVKLTGDSPGRDVDFHWLGIGGVGGRACKKQHKQKRFAEGRSGDHAVALLCLPLLTAGVRHVP